MARAVDDAGVERARLGSAPMSSRMARVSLFRRFLVRGGGSRKIGRGCRGGSKIFGFLIVGTSFSAKGSTLGLYGVGLSRITRGRVGP